MRFHDLASLVLIASVLLVPSASLAQSPAVPSAAAELPLFAVEIKTGPKWDFSKVPGDQTYFREHSANLRRLRDAGALVMGARYGDKGLVILAAESLAAAKAMMDQDPAMTAGTFAYDAQAFKVFYPGNVQVLPRK